MPVTVSSAVFGVVLMTAETGRISSAAVNGAVRFTVTVVRSGLPLRLAV